MASRLHRTILSLCVGVGSLVFIHAADAGSAPAEQSYECNRRCGIDGIAGLLKLNFWEKAAIGLSGVEYAELFDTMLRLEYKVRDDEKVKISNPKTRGARIIYRNYKERKAIAERREIARRMLRLLLVTEHESMAPTDAAHAEDLISIKGALVDAILAIDQNIDSDIVEILEVASDFVRWKTQTPGDKLCKVAPKNFLAAVGTARSFHVKTVLDTECLALAE